MSYYYECFSYCIYQTHNYANLKKTEFLQIEGVHYIKVYVKLLEMSALFLYDGSRSL